MICLTEVSGSQRHMSHRTGSIKRRFQLTYKARGQILYRRKQTNTAGPGIVKAAEKTKPGAESSQDKRRETKNTTAAGKRRVLLVENKTKRIKKYIAAGSR